MQLTALIGKKTYQKQGFLQDGRRVPLSAINVLGNVVSQIKTQDKEDYNALQLGIDIKKKAKKSLQNHSKKAGLENTPRFFREVRVDDTKGAKAGAEINVSEVFKAGDMVDVTGVSKGKGFAGVVKRHGFHGGPRTHGQSDRERAPGSIGQTTTPGRVYKGKKMAGRMGQDTVTVKNLEVIEVTNDGVLLIKGLVPGSLNSVVVVKKTGENKKFVPLYTESEEQLEEKSAGHPSVSDDVQKNGNGSSSVSEDAQQTQPETQSVESASLNESQPPILEENQEVKPEAALSSSENVQAPIAKTSTTDEPAVGSSENVQAPIATQNDQRQEEVKEENANS